MATVEISIQNRVARLAAGVVLVCNNPTDTVRFVFDDETAEYPSQICLKSANKRWAIRVDDNGEISTTEIV